MRRLCLALLLLPTACKPKPPPPDPGYIDDLLLSNEGGTALLERGADLALRAGRHAITIRVQPAAGDPPLRLLWSGPGFTKRPVPAASLWRAY